MGRRFGESVVRAVSFLHHSMSAMIAKMTPTKTVIWTVVGSLLVLVSGCIVQPLRFDDTNASMRNAQLRGQIKQALAHYESEAREAEHDASTSFFPQLYWGFAVNAYLQAASAARVAGQLQKAITYGEKALEIAQRTQVSALALARGSDQGNFQPPPLPEINAINNLIHSYTSVRDFDKARVLANQGLTLLRENPAGDKNTRLSVESTLYVTLGNDFLRRREYEEAIDYLELAVYLQRSHFASRSRMSRILAENSQIELTSRLINLARAYTLSGRLDDALASYSEASKHISYGGTRVIQERAVYSGLAQTYMQQRQFSLAIENFQKALALAEKQQQSEGIRSASRGLAAALRQTGNAAGAIPYYEKAIQQTESTRSFLQSENYRQSFFEGSVSAYSGMIESLSESGKPDEAFNYSERARSRAFLDLLGSKARLSKAKGGLFEEERALQERIAAIRVRLSDEDDGDVDRAALRKELSDAEAAYSVFLSKVRKEDKEQASLMTVEPLTLKEVQEFLDPQTTLVEYYVSERNAFVWVVEKDKLQLVTVETPRERLAGLVKDLRESIFTLGEKDKFNEASALLYKQLIGPLLPHISGKELIIVPHDVLHYLPFHALVGSDGRYLIEKYPVYYLSSASLLQFVKEKRKAGGEKVLAFGNPDLGDPEKNLEFAELEAREVKAAYPESSIYIRKEATEEKSKTLSAEHDILHFATHAKLNEDDPLSSAVLLAKEDKEDGRLEVREIFGMDLKANLVVLSGCETGLGKLSTGDELVGLTRAFIYAGTPSVVASLWSVDDSSTAHLMASFYRNLKTMSKVEALRQAQLELIRGEGRSDLLARRGVGGIGKLGEGVSESQDRISVSTSHPYFWAPFILVGDGK
jgi:CHAT domain-containing protein